MGAENEPSDSTDVADPINFTKPEEVTVDGPNKGAKDTMLRREVAENTAEITKTQIEENQRRNQPTRPSHINV